jgi:hypothetical protein
MPGGHTHSLILNWKIYFIGNGQRPIMANEWGKCAMERWEVFFSGEGKLCASQNRHENLFVKYTYTTPLPLLPSQFKVILLLFRIKLAWAMG